MNAHRARPRLRQRGIAAVELAILMLFTGFLIPVIFLFGRVFYHYNIISQATQDAANYMASVPVIEMRTAAGMTQVQARARQMVVTAIASAGITPPEDLVISVHCNSSDCLWSIPVQDVQVNATFILADGFWQDTGRWLPHDSTWTFSASSTAIYQN